MTGATSGYRPLGDAEREAFLHYAREGKGPSSSDLLRWAEGYLAMEEQTWRLEEATRGAEDALQQGRLEIRAIRERP